MREEQLLEKYVSEHPDFWEFENEIEEVAILKRRIKQATASRPGRFELED